LGTLDDEINDDELLDRAKETMQIERQVKPKKRLKPRIIRVFGSMSNLNQKNTTVTLLCLLRHGEMKKLI